MTGELLIQILPEKPSLSGEVYAPVMPKWTANLLRLVSLGFAGACLWLGLHEWATMPLFAKVIVVLVGPAMLFGALHPKGFAAAASTPYFLADKSGMYFPHHDSSITFVGSGNEDRRKKSRTWLFLSWDEISNLRIAKMITHDGVSNVAAFDIPLNTESFTEYLYDHLSDKTASQGMRAVAFYVNVPPTAKRVVTDVQLMMDRYKVSDLRKKYARRPE